MNPIAWYTTGTPAAKTLIHSAPATDIDLSGVDALSIASVVDVYFRRGPAACLLAAEREEDLKAITLTLQGRTLVVALRGRFAARGGVSGLGSVSVSGGGIVSGRDTIIGGRSRHRADGIVSGRDTVIDGVKQRGAGEDVVRVGRLAVCLALPTLRSLELQGAADATIHDLDQDEVTLTIAGSGNVTLDGRAVTLLATVQGSGDVDARRLRTKSARLEIQGAGSLHAHVEDSVVARVQGAGDVRIDGNPLHRVVQVSGVGDVSFR